MSTLKKVFEKRRKFHADLSAVATLKYCGEGQLIVESLCQHTLSRLFTNFFILFYCIEASLRRLCRSDEMWVGILVGDLL
jgi:hypothetical protein